MILGSGDIIAEAISRGISCILSLLCVIYCQQNYYLESVMLSLSNITAFLTTPQLIPPFTPNYPTLIRHLTSASLSHSLRIGY